MKTPASHWTVLVAVVVSIGVGLWSTGRAVQRTESPLRAADPEIAFFDESHGVHAHVLATPTEDTQRGAVELPFDDALCGVSPDETMFTVVVKDEAGVRLRGARVALFESAGNSTDVGKLIESVASEDGRVCVRTKSTGALHVGVFATGFAPSTRRVDSATGTRVDLEPFVLTRGAAIDGTVLVGGQPLARVEVEITANPAGNSIEIGEARYAWRAQRFVLARTTTRTDAQGHYALAGLDPGEHDVRLKTVRQRDVAVDVNRVPPVRASAPQSGIDFALPAARLELHVRSKGSPLCCVEVQIEAGDRQFTRTSDDAGRLVVLLQPALAYPLILTRRGFETKRLQLRGLIDGERLVESVELDPQSETAQVIVDDETKAGVDTAVFAFRPRSPLMHGSAFERTVERDAATKTFVIRDVPSGNWMATMRTGRIMSAPSTMEGHAPLTLRSNCDVEFNVTVPSEGIVRARAGVNRRGGVEVLVREASGRRLAARVKVFDGRGEEVDALSLRSEALSTFEIAAASRSEDTLFVCPAACFGSFELAVFKEGYRTRRVPFTQLPGQFAVLDVLLEPE